MPENIPYAIKGATFYQWFTNSGNFCVFTRQGRYILDLELMNFSKNSVQNFFEELHDGHSLDSSQYKCTTLYYAEWSKTYGNEGAISNRALVTLNNTKIMEIVHDTPEPIDWNGFIDDKYVVTYSDSQTRVTPIAKEFA